MTENKKSRVNWFRAAFLFVVAFGGILGAAAVFHPDSPLPDEWNPTRALIVDAKITPLTAWKLERTLASPSLCLSALDAATQIQKLPPLETSNPKCGVENQVRLSKVGASRIDPIQTSCAIALRMAMWERHGIQPIAQEIFGTDVAIIRQVGSYNCRAMRTSSGSTGRMSSHATASAIDITGFDLADGRRIRLIRDWDSDDDTAEFLRQVRDSSCDWFRLTLSPDYNALHADHFHLQSTGWGLCR